MLFRWSTGSKRVGWSRRPVVAGCALIAALALCSCVYIGKDFNADAVGQIKPGVTTTEDVLKVFGNPVRVGMEDGKVVWTYLRYHANIAGDFDGKDLIVRFDTDNKVIGLSFNSTETGRDQKR